MQHLSANKLFVCMCQHSSCTVFIQGRVKLSKYIVCKFCSVPLQLLLGMGREFSAATVLRVLSSQLKHRKSCCSDHVYKAVSAKCPAQNCLLLSWRRWESRTRGSSEATCGGGLDRGWGCSSFEWRNIVHPTPGTTDVRTNSERNGDYRCQLQAWGSSAEADVLGHLFSILFVNNLA